MKKFLYIVGNRLTLSDTNTLQSNNLSQTEFIQLLGTVDFTGDWTMRMFETNVEFVHNELSQFNDRLDKAITAAVNATAKFNR